MRSHTATSCQDTFGHSHTSKVFGRCFDTNHHHALTGSTPFSCIIGKEHNLTTSSTRRSRQTTSQHLSLFQSRLIKYRVKQLIKLIGFATHQSCLFVDHTLTKQIHSNLHHSSTRTLTVTCLEEPKFAFLYSELHILHIAIVVFKLRLQSIQFFIDFRHSLFHGRILGSTFFFADTCQFSPTL